MSHRRTTPAVLVELLREHTNAEARAPYERLRVDAEALLRVIGAIEDPRTASQGLTLSGLRISNGLAWKRCEIPWSITFSDCEFEDTVDFSNSRLRDLTLVDCTWESSASGFNAARANVDEDLRIERCSPSWLMLEKLRVEGGIAIVDSEIGMSAKRSDADQVRTACVDLGGCSAASILISSTTVWGRASLFESEASDIRILESRIGVSQANVRPVWPAVTIDTSSPTTYGTLWLSQVTTRNAVQLGPSLEVWGDIRMVDARVGTALRIGTSTNWADRHGVAPAQSQATVVRGGLVNLLRTSVGSRTELALAQGSVGQEPALTPPILLNDGAFADLTMFGLNLSGESGRACLDGASYASIQTPSPEYPPGKRPHAAGLPELDVIRAYAASPPPPGSAATSLFRGQPYQELARSLTAQGRSAQARTTLITMMDDERRYGDLSRSRRLWNAISGLLVGHGYALHRSAIPLVVAVALAFGVTLLGQRSDAFIATQPSIAVSSAEVLQSSNCTDDYPCLDPFVYTLDSLIPVVDFYQTAYWQPKASWWGKDALIALTVVAWLLVSLLVAGLSSVGRRDHESGT